MYYKNHNDLSSDEICECLELINNLQDVFYRYLNLAFGCTAFSFFDEIIPDEVYKMVSYMSTNGVEESLSRVSIRNKILSSDLNDISRIRAEIIADWAYCFQFIYIGRASKIVMYANIDIKHVLENVPYVCKPYDNDKFIEQFLNLTKDYSVAEKECEEHLLLTKHLDEFDVSIWNEIFIQELNIFQINDVICSLNETQKRKLLQDLPQPIILAMLDLITEFKPNLESISSSQKRFYERLTKNITINGNSDTSNTTMEASRLLIGIDLNSKEQLRKLRDELLEVHPKHFDLYKPLTQYVCKVDKPLFYLIYELFLLHVPRDVIDQIAVKYIILNNFSREEQLEAVLFLIFISCLKSNHYDYELTSIILDQIVS